MLALYHQLLLCFLFSVFWLSEIVNVFQVERECDGLQYQVEVRNITQRVAALADKLDSASSLCEPRENSFLTCDFAHNDALTILPQQLKRYVHIEISRWLF